MNTKTKIIIGAIVLAGVSFYAGTLVKGSTPAQSANGARGQFSARTGGQGMMRTGGQVTAGKVISKDDKSVTVSLRDGGSKIIFFTASTSIEKPTKADIGELASGTQISAIGSSLPDGSISAQSIQIRASQNQPTN